MKKTPKKVEKNKKMTKKHQKKWKKHKICEQKNCRNLLLGSPVIINKMQVCRNCYLKIKFERKIDRMSKKCIVNHKNNKSSATPLKQAKKHYPTTRWAVVSKDGKIIEKFRSKENAKKFIKERKLYFEDFELREL